MCAGKLKLWGDVIYFINEQELKFLQRRLLNLARNNPISEELRGWNWFESPLKPYYDNEKLPMYLVSSEYCPTRRDVFLNRVLKKKGEINFNVSLGLGVHQTTSNIISGFQNNQKLEFESWWSQNLNKISNPAWAITMKPLIKEVWDYVSQNCETAVSNLMASQPFAKKEDVLRTSLPFLVEHVITGSYLGLSGTLKIDAYDYLRNIVYDLKTSTFEKPEYRLYTTGYALVLESVYDIPIDIGGLVYVNFENGKIIVKKDLFVINNELRSLWIEERDKKLDMVAQKKDPGIPKNCPKECIYSKDCA